MSTVMGQTLHVNCVGLNPKQKTNIGILPFMTKSKFSAFIILIVDKDTIFWTKRIFKLVYNNILSGRDCSSLGPPGLPASDKNIL